MISFEFILNVYSIFLICIYLLGKSVKVISESGGPAMLTDSGILAQGSLRRFIECLSYNRCKRLHPMIALALETLLFRQFMKDYENSDLVHLELKNVLLEKKEDVDRICKSALFVELFEAFEKFKDSAESGELGRTAQFWAMYI